MELIRRRVEILLKNLRQVLAGLEKDTLDYYRVEAKIEVLERLLDD
jgi:hypothetical protein